MWKNIQTEKVGLSAGRVQSTLLKILKEHEDKINNFESEYEYDFTGNFEYDKNKIECELLFDIDDIEPIEIMKILKKDRIFNLISSKNLKKKYPGVPFITSSLQQSAQNELGFPVKMTMDIGQKLYENGKITYMRTDSTYISKDFFKKLLKIKLSMNIQKNIIKNFQRQKKVKGAQST